MSFTFLLFYMMKFGRVTFLSYFLFLFFSFFLKVHLFSFQFHVHRLYVSLNLIQSLNLLSEFVFRFITYNLPI